MRGQGLPLSTIVLAALAILVLILLVGFVTGAFSKFFRSTSRVTSSTSLQSIQSECQMLCTSANMHINNIVESVMLSTSASDPTQEESKIIGEIEYCTKVFYVNGKTVHCWQSPINVPCIIQFSWGGKTYVIKPSSSGCTIESLGGTTTSKK